MITQTEVTELINLYHLANTALAALHVSRVGRYERKCWAVRQFASLHPGISKVRAYKALSEALS